MRKTIAKLALLTSLLLIPSAQAAKITEDTLILGKPGSSSDKKILVGPTGTIKFNASTSKLQFAHDGLTFKDVGSGNGSGYAIPLLTDNTDFEAGIGNWTQSGGTFNTSSATGVNIAQGSKSAYWLPSAGSQTIVSPVKTIVGGLVNKSCISKFRYKTAESTNKYILNLLDGSGTVVGTRTLDAATDFTPVYASGPCGTSISAQVQFQLKAASSTPSSPIYFDDAWLGGNTDEVSLSQASMYATALWPGVTSCQWTTTSNSWADFSAVAACNNPTVTGGATAPATKVPHVVLNGMPAGFYEASITMPGTSTSTAAASCYFRLVDESGNSWASTDHYNDSPGQIPINFSGVYNYTTAGNHTLKLQIRNDNNALSCGVYPNGTDANILISIKRFPTSTDQAISMSTAGGVWAGYHSNDCGWTTTSASYADPSGGADASCTFVERVNQAFGTVTSYGSKLPGIVFTPNRAGAYMACVRTTAWGGTSGQTLAFDLFDGTNSLGESGEQTDQNWKSHTICGLVNATSTGSVTLRLRSKIGGGTTLTIGSLGNTTLDWLIYPVNQQMPAPYLADMPKVYSNSANSERIERLSIDSACAVTIGTACTISSQSGSWVSSVTHTGTGSYTVNIAGGMFSAIPTCLANATAAVHIGRVVAPTTTSAISIATVNNSFASTDAGFSLICMGPK